MATTATRTCNDIDMKQFSSAQYRRHIGLQKKQLERQMSIVHTTLTDYDIQPTNREVAHLEDNKIEFMRADISSTKASLSQCFQKLIQSHSGWAARQEVDRVEQGVFEEKIPKYGDYRDLIKSTGQLLQQLEGLLDSVDQEHISRNLGVVSHTASKPHFFPR
ncbi:unnamed protein product [Heligmosomoides polygyrus]|uniref:BAR domain-containing protein n=1 Tax=Heligmosomoides polygyrus TaxID=6339 RepID=A0A183G943_HELPZ|nr:unnamed protein product [Heligmosomoides polygyrus]